MFREVYRWFKMRKGVKECARRATILAVWAVENLHYLPLPYIYICRCVGAGFLASLFNSPRAQCLRIKGMF